MHSHGSSVIQAAAAAAGEGFFGCKIYTVQYYLRYQNYNFTMGNTHLKYPPSTNHGHIPIPLLETEHPKRAGSDLTKT